MLISKQNSKTIGKIEQKLKLRHRTNPKTLEIQLNSTAKTTYRKLEKNYLNSITEIQNPLPINHQNGIVIGHGNPKHQNHKALK